MNVPATSTQNARGSARRSASIELLLGEFIVGRCADTGETKSPATVKVAGFGRNELVIRLGFFLRTAALRTLANAKDDGKRPHCRGGNAVKAGVLFVLRAIHRRRVLA